MLVIHNVRSAFKVSVAAGIALCQIASTMAI